MKQLTIVDAIKGPFRPFFEDAEGSLTSWHPWLAACRLIHNLPVPKASQPIVEKCTGRSYANLKGVEFSTILMACGRRSGKSKCAAGLGAYSALLENREAKLSKGEKGIVAVVSPTRQQSQLVKGYIRSIFTGPLADAVTKETRDGVELCNGNRIAILSGDFRTVRGYTLLAAIVDEAAFFGVDEAAKVKSDTELLRAIQPALITTGGKLIAITSPYARKGWCWDTYQKNFGNPNGRTLVWNAPSMTMNPTLPQSVVDAAYEEDLQSAKAEFGAEFRDAVAAFIPRDVVESLVVRGRLQLMPMPGIRYCAFADLSGGRKDDAALAIAHRDGQKVVLDSLQVFKAPFDPIRIVGFMAEHLRSFGLKRVTGDNYGADFLVQAFQRSGIYHAKAEKTASELYLTALPRMCSGQIELLDNPVLVDQFASLERRTRSGGRDIVDHPTNSNCHDDLANAVAGVSDLCGNRPLIRVGGL